MNELVLIMIMLATIVYIAQPYWNKQAILAPRASNGRLAELIEQRDTLLAQIKEIEFDRETGKISSEDFAEINARYRSEAVSLFRRIDAARGNNRSVQKLEAELKKAKAQRSKEAEFCQQCGQSVKADDHFCSSCGNQLTI